MAEPVADLEFTFDEIPQNKPLNFGGRNVWPQIAFFLVCLRNLFEVPDADVNGKIFVGRYCCRLLHRDIPGQDVYKHVRMNWGNYSITCRVRRRDVYLVGIWSHRLQRWLAFSSTVNLFPPGTTIDMGFEENYTSILGVADLNMLAVPLGRNRLRRSIRDLDTIVGGGHAQARARARAIATTLIMVFEGGKIRSIGGAMQSLGPNAIIHLTRRQGGTITEWGTISERIIRYFRSHAPTPSELVRYLHRDYRNPVQFQQVPLEMHYPPEVVDSYEQAAAELVLLVDSLPLRYAIPPRRR